MSLKKKKDWTKEDVNAIPSLSRITAATTLIEHKV